MANLKVDESLTTKVKKILENTTVYIQDPYRNTYIEIDSPKDIQDTDGMVSVITKDGAVWTAHVSRVLIYTKPQEVTDNDN